MPSKFRLDVSVSTLIDISQREKVQVGSWDQERHPDGRPQWRRNCHFGRFVDMGVLNSVESMGVIACKKSGGRKCSSPGRKLVINAMIHIKQKIL